MRAHGWYRKVDWAGVDDQRGNFDQVVLNSTATIYPPLYFLVAGHWMRLWGAQELEARLFVTRLLSWLLYLGTAWAALAFGRTLFDDERAALCVAALVAFLPMSARQAALVNNDVLAKFLSAVVLWLAARWLTRKGAAWELLVALVVWRAGAEDQDHGDLGGGARWRWRSCCASSASARAWGRSSRCSAGCSSPATGCCG